MIRVSILGATGYSGGELLRLLLSDPSIKIQHITSESSPGHAVSSAHPSLRGRCALSFESVNVKAIAADSDVVFSCFPAGIGIKPITQLVKLGIKVIDLSADFRLTDSSAYQTWYKLKHSSPHLLAQAAYGLPELYRDKIKTSMLIANPGCYATAAILSAVPLVEAHVIEPKSLVIDAKSGVSGAGKKVSLSYIYNEVDENLSAYSVASHRHQPEIEQVLGERGRKKITVTFTPHLIPMKRGILSVLYATLIKPLSLSDIRSLFMKRYKGEPFIRIMPDNELPQTKNVTHTNYCDIGIKLDSRVRRVIVLAAIDNLVKGAAGQALQNMNLSFHREETRGLL